MSDTDVEVHSDEEMVQKLIQERFPDMMLVLISDFENEDHQSYKHLYKKLASSYEKLEADFHNTRYSLEEAEREAADLSSELEKQAEFNGQLKNQTQGIMEFIKKMTEKDIVVSDIRPMDASGHEIRTASDNRKEVLEKDLSLNPGIYGFRRASWFSPLQTELNKGNIAKKTVLNTQNNLEEKISFWKRIFRKVETKEVNIDEAANEIDVCRREKVCKLLNSNDSNDEKYIKYMLLTPGIPKDFMKTLMGASELGVDANVVIQLLEQPKESFNWEIIEAYISKVHKATEYNIKRELANELIRGDWYVVSDINGSLQKYQMVPFDILNEVKQELNDICDILSGISKPKDAGLGSDEITDAQIEEFEENFELPADLDDVEVSENLFSLYEENLDEELKSLL